MYQRTLDRFWRIAGRASIRVKVLGIVVGVIVVLGVAIILQMRSLLRANLEQELQLQGIDLIGDAEQGAASLAELGNWNTLNALLEELKTHYSSPAHNTLVAYIVVTDANGQPITSVGQAPPSAAISVQTLTKTPQIKILQSGEHTIMDIVASLPSGGAIWLGLAEDNIDQTVFTVTTQLLSTTLIMVAFGFAPAFFLTWILTRPIYNLVEATHAVEQGDFTREVQRWADDELGELAVAFNQMTRSLAKADKERSERELLRAQYVSGVIVAQEDERKRIARELHDSTSQSLTSLLVGLQNLKAAPNATALSDRIDELRTIIGHTLDEVRTMAWRLRPLMLDDLGLISALQRHIDDFQHRYGVKIDLLVTDVDERLPIEMETSIYRIVQEALTNIARYAHANSASVIIDRHGHNLQIIIEDDGVGFEPEAVKGQGKSLGLQGIRERAALFGGRLEIESAPQQGTTLYIELPLVNANDLPRADDTNYQEVREENDLTNTYPSGG